MVSRLFLFLFGYWAPYQWAANEEHGWDDEDSQAFFIEAGSRDEAMQRGRAIANAYVSYLFKKAAQPMPMEWVDAQFAHWIEDEPRRKFTDEELGSLPIVHIGEPPDFGTWE